jgi:membrane-associated protease RseP (regulator of RpoE activity)
VPLNAETRATYEVRSTARQGAIIHSVRPGSPADLAGLPVGGVIVSIDGMLVKSSDELAAAVAGGRPGQEVELRYMLDGDRVATKTVRLAPASAIGSVPAFPPAADGLTDRSSLRRFSDTLDPGSASSLSEIQESIQALTEKISALEERLKLLEDKPGAGAPALTP